MAGKFRVANVTDKLPALLVGVGRQQRSKPFLKICICLEGDQGYEEMKQGNDMECDGTVF